MTVKRNGLMALWTEIAPDYLARFREWHNCEHMPERVSVPGFIAGRRYVEVGGRTILMMYETEDAAVLGSDAYLARLNDPTPWTAESLAYFRGPSRNIYSLLADAGATDFVAAPYMITVRCNGDIGADDVRRIKGIAGVGRVRLYAIDAAVTGIETAERKIYAAGGMPRAADRLLLIEAAVAELPALAQAATAWQDVSIDSFAVDYVLDRTMRG